MRTGIGRSEWDEFLEMLSPGPGEKILDIGAGDCAKAERVLQASKGGDLFAVDPDAKRISAARRERPLVKSSVAGAESLPFPGSSFDKAYSTLALHHFADLDKALGEVARVLKPGGSYVILEVEPRSFFGRVFRFFGRLTGEPMQMLTIDQLLAKAAGQKGLAPGRSRRLGGTYLLQLTRV